MAPSKEELELGMRAYHRVRLFEQYGERNMRQTPWILAACLICIVLLDFIFEKRFERGQIILFVMLLGAAFLWNWAQRHIARDTYAQQKLILHLLAEKYGNALPWVAEEEQLTLFENLDRTIARTSSTY